MSIHNPFPPRGEPDGIDVFLFFWVPVILIIGIPLAGIIFGIFSTLMSLLFGG